MSTRPCAWQRCKAKVLGAELRWILLGLSLPLLAGIWWWTARRAGQAPGNAELRESTPPLDPRYADADDFGIRFGVRSGAHTDVRAERIASSEISFYKGFVDNHRALPSLTHRQRLIRRGLRAQRKKLRIQEPRFQKRLDCSQTIVISERHRQRHERRSNLREQ